MKDCLCCLVNVIFLSSDLDHSLSPCTVHLSLKCSNCSRRVFCFCFFCLLFLFKRECLLICVFAPLLKWLVYTIMFVVPLPFSCHTSNFKFLGHCKQYERVWYRINKKVFVLERENNRAKDDEIQSVNMHLKERY